MQRRRWNQKQLRGNVESAKQRDSNPQDAQPSEHYQILRVFLIQETSMHRDRIRPKRWPTKENQGGQEQRQAAIIAADPRLVLPAGSRARPHSLEKHPTPRSETKKHPADEEQRDQNWWFRYFKNAWEHFWHGEDGNGHAVLPVARGLPRAEVRQQVGHVDAWMHSVWDVRPAAPFRGWVAESSAESNPQGGAEKVEHWHQTNFPQTHGAAPAENRLSPGINSRDTRTERDKREHRQTE